MSVSNTESIEIELRSKDEQKLEEIWAHLKSHLGEHNPGLPYSPLQHILRELVFNSIKANLKRIFIEEKGAADPAVAALDFREALETVSPDLLKKAEASDRYVRVRFVGVSQAPGGFEISVFNNTEMLPGERELVDRLLYTDEQVGEEAEAPSGESVSGEGGGLGLRMVRKILQNCGLGHGALQYETSPARTAFILRVPAGGS